MDSGTAAAASENVRTSRDSFRSDAHLADVARAIGGIRSAVTHTMRIDTRFIFADGKSHALANDDEQDSGHGASTRGDRRKRRHHAGLRRPLKTRCRAPSQNDV